MINHPDPFELTFVANASQLLKGWFYLKVSNIQIKHVQTVESKIQKQKTLTLSVRVSVPEAGLEPARANAHKILRGGTIPKVREISPIQQYYAELR